MEEINALESAIRFQQTRYYGKYRAFIANNEDPEKRGRCKLIVPSILGDEETDWALPCTPYGGGHGYGTIAVPPVDAQVLAEFLEGDVSSPIWTGSFWRSSQELPEAFGANSSPSAKVTRTESGHTLVFEDKEGEEKVSLTSSAESQFELDEHGTITLTAADGAMVTLDASGGEIGIEDANGNSMRLSSGGVVIKDASGNEISTSSSGISIKGSATITIEGTSVAVGGAGGEPLIKGSTFLGLFNGHTHNCTAPGSPSGPPIPPLTPSVLTTTSTAS